MAPTLIVLAVGFGATGQGDEALGPTLGMTRAEARGGGAGEVIQSAAVECALGWVSVAATERGVCLIELGDSAKILRAQLPTRFPKADFREGDANFDRWVRLVVKLIERPGSSFDLPLDIRGTAFQRQVWEALRAIPAGEIVTYSELARRIGFPSATRAVAGACAANRLAVVIPCHRVVRTGGGLGGYRWGLVRKQELLDRESPTGDPGEAVS